MLPTILIAIVIVIAIAALLVVRARQNKNTTDNKKSKITSKSTKAVESVSAVEAKSAAPKIDIDNLLTQLNLLITDKEFAKAEASINLHLKQDPSLHDLYPKLADIYHAQEDDFAIKQLLDTLQKNNLNEVYQRVFNEHETFKAEQEKKHALEQSQKTPDVFEFTPSTPTTVDNSSDFDSLASADTASTTQQDNSLDFSSLVSAPPSTIENTTTEEPALSFDSLITTPETQPAASTESPTLDFNLSAPATETTTSAQELNLDFDLATPSTEAAPTTNLDFKLDAPATEASSPSLDFSLDTPTVDTPAATSPSLDFSLDIPTADTPAATSPSLDFSLDTPVVESTTSDSNNFNLAPEVTEASQPTTDAGQYADANDPIVQSFAELAHTNPVDLDIELAEQYIRLGANQAAKSLLQNQSNLSADQATKVDTLLQKIA